MLRNPYLKDENRCSTPVYVPGESYSFCVNSSELSSDPNFNSLSLQIVTVDDVVVKSDFANLLRAFPYTGSPLYVIYSTFAFPYGVQSGFFHFRIWDPSRQEVLLRSNCILVENEITDNTMRLEWRHRSEKFGVPYDIMNGAGGNSPFMQRFRLPISQIDIQFESEKSTYRNASNRKQRTISTDRDRNVTIEGRMFDEMAHEAFSAVLEHEEIYLDGLRLEPKTALSISTNVSAKLNKSTFDAFANDADQHGIFGENGDIVVLCGDARNLALYYNRTVPNDPLYYSPLLSDDGYILLSEDGTPLLAD